MAENINKKDKNNCSIIVDALLDGMNGVLATKTVVGEPTKIGDVIIVPLVDVTFGIGAGASLSDETGKKHNGGGGIGGKMTPSAVLVIQDGSVKLVNVKNQDTITKILDMVPDLVDKFSSKKAEKEMLDDDQAKEIAFGEEKED